MPRDWDARTYDRVADPMTRWGSVVLERLPLGGDERVLDAGCGSGRVTEQLAQRLPRGTVVALDGSPSMVEAARDRLARFGDRVEYVVADLGRPLPIEPVDAILSTATFHWVPDHDALFANLAAVLRPGGRLVAQCGGAGNIDNFHGVVHDVADEAPFDAYIGAWEGPWNYAGPSETGARLAAAGFTDAECWLQDWPVSPEEPEEFIRVVCLGHHLERLPEELRPRFVERVFERAPKPLTLDYIRLNIDARRPE
jgi:trans-aconitate 2-methyltransferase